MDTIEKTIHKICSETSLTPGEVRTNIEDWALALMMKGIIVKKEIKRWRAKIAMTEEDFFLKKDGDSEWEDFQSNYIDFGRKLIIPKRIDTRLNRIERNARRNLYQYSFDTVWGPFVPCTVFDEWKENDEEYRKEYMKARDSLCSEWDSIRLEILDEYRSFSKILYKKTKPDISYSDFENKVISKVSQSLMSADSFYRSFVYDSIFMYIPIPTQIQTELYFADKINDDRDKIQKDMEMRDFVHKETMKKKSEQIDNFLNETVLRIRDMMFSIIEEVKLAVALDRSCVSTGKMRKKLFRMIERIRKVDFFSDEDIKNALDKLQLDLEKENDYRSDDEIIRSLEELEALAKADITKVGLGRARLLEI